MLDQDYKKIVVFAPDGRVKNVILGGYGEGPGEFVLPFDLRLMPDGHRLAVLDYANQRISFFARTGQFLETIRSSERVGRVLPVKDNELWMSRAFARSDMAVSCWTNPDGKYETRLG